MKIDIIGSVASGKTTLAKRISKKYSIPSPSVMKREYRWIYDLIFILKNA